LITQKKSQNFGSLDAGEFKGVKNSFPMLTVPCVPAINAVESLTEKTSSTHWQPTLESTYLLGLVFLAVPSRKNVFPQSNDVVECVRDN
jgi:hypothetical protein